jgi:hypothetical protein
LRAGTSRIGFGRPAVERAGDEQHRDLAAESRPEVVPEIRHVQRLDETLVADARVDGVAEDGARRLRRDTGEPLARNAGCDVHRVRHRRSDRPLANHTLHRLGDRLQANALLETVEEDRQRPQRKTDRRFAA